jgi:diaminohydroxyphosphoribosylaminopyrimidine deaminase / 5-amino-6-(5-phosphoribosylamino)uracil reductase
MRRALALARRGRFTAAPNPCVGAVLLAADGRLLGEGWHRRAGEPHAEIHALAAGGDRARGATLYITLEPCAHFGRTPPCVDAVIAAGLRRVVVAHRDPDPRTAGRGIERLRAAGIEVEVGALAEEAIALNLPFVVTHLRHRPAVTLKWAASLDGRIATGAGESRWITGERARRAALELREEHDTILVGSGTLLADDPRLTRRLGRAPGAIRRVVLDRRLRTPPEARLLAEAGEALVYTESADGGRAAVLAERGAEVVRLPRVGAPEVLSDLARRGAQSVLVEGGGTAAATFFEAGLWERIVAFQAPRLLGGAEAPGPLGGRGVERLAAAELLEGVRLRRLGSDWEIRGTRTGCLRELSSSVAG